MSDDVLNITTMNYDYNEYYGEGMESSVQCNNGNVLAFSSVFLPALYSSVFILGFIGNALVLCVLVKYHNQTNMTDFCLLNLAISDLIFVISLPFFSHFANVGHWVFGDFMCHFTSGLHTLGFFSSIFFMVAMTLDRYVVIMHAHKAARHRTVRAGAILSVFVWVLSLLISLPTFVMTEVKNVSSVLHCTFNPESSDWKTYDLVTMNVLGLVIPLLVMIVCYSRIIPTLVSMKTAKKHRVVKLIITIVAVFFLFWTPCNIVFILTHLQQEGILSSDCDLERNLTVATMVTEAIAYTHCCLNPIIYAFVGQKFMGRVSRMMRMWLSPCSSLCPRELSESFRGKISVSSRSSEVTSTFVL